MTSKHRQQAILKASLYLFKYQLEDKIERTSREPEQRLKEVGLDLEQATGKAVIKSTILCKVANYGHVENVRFSSLQQSVS